MSTIKNNIAVASFAFLSAIAPAGADQKATFAAPDRLDDTPDAVQETVIIGMGCGKEDKANCKVIVPSIANKISDSGLALKGVGSKGSVQSADAVCAGKIAMALGQADAIKQVSEKAECRGKVVTFGSPVSQYVGYLVVRADNQAGSLDEMVKKANGRALQVADGGAGSGGRVTLQTIVEAEAGYKSTISLRNESGDFALSQLASGQLDAVFFMDGRDSSLVRTVRESKGKDEKPLYKFVDVSVPSDVYARNNVLGDYKIYEPTELVTKGWTNRNIKTVSVGAVMAVSTAFTSTDEGRKAAVAVNKAANMAEADIRAGTQTPKDWKPTAVQRCSFFCFR